MMERFFAPCPRGLEDVLAAELAELGADEITAADGGVAFGGPIDLAYRANLESRLASRILWQVGHGAYRDEQDIYQLALDLDWPRWFRADRTLRVDVAATRSPLTSLEFATLRIKDAVCDRHRAGSGVRPSVSKDQPDVRVHAYLTAGEATFYLDTSGEPLFKRGYRRQTAEAPLRENLAAGLLRLARWQPGTPLLDPLCGSGTIAIEAALIALDIAPGLKRTFGFQKLGWYDGPAWQRIKQAAQRRMRAVEGAAIYARDVDDAAIRQCHVNIEAAGVAGAIAVEQIDALVGTAPANEGAIVTNPPYGVRPGRLERAGGVLSAPWRRAQAALRGVDRFPAKWRHATAETDRAQGEPAHSALQWRPRMPALRIPSGRGLDASATAGGNGR